MFKNDEAGVYLGNVAHDVYPVLNNLGGRYSPTFDVKIYLNIVSLPNRNGVQVYTSSIKCSPGLTVASPNNRPKTHCSSEGPNSVTENNNQTIEHGSNHAAYSMSP